MEPLLPAQKKKKMSPVIMFPRSSSSSRIFSSISSRLSSDCGYILFLVLIFIVSSVFFLFLFGFIKNVSTEEVRHSTTNNAFVLHQNKYSVILKTDNKQTSSTTNLLPNALIIGARKCGTRALLDFLNVHANVRIAPEEVHYFDNDAAYKRGLGWYRTHMPSAGAIPGKADQCQVVAEKSPSYFVSPVVPQRVAELNPHMKLILILKNPVDRTISDYAQMVENRARKGRRFKSLQQTVLNRNSSSVNPHSRLIDIGVYHRHLVRWLHRFPRHQLHIADGNKLIDDPFEEVRRVEHFLGLKSGIRPADFVFNSTKGFYCINKSSSSSSPTSAKTLSPSVYCLGEGKGRKHPKVNKKIREKLRQFFAPHNERLYSAIGYRFDW